MIEIGRAARSVTPIIVAAVTALFASESFAGVPFQTKPSVNEQAEVLIEREPGRMARHYSLSAEDCRVSWIVFESVPNRGVIQNRTSCSRPLREQMPALSRILALVSKDLEAIETPHTFVWGRLTPDERQDDLEMALRLALAAHKSASWDAKLGRPQSGHVNNFVVQIANREMIYPELKELFEGCGFELKLTHAEKVLVMSAGKLTFFDRLKGAGVRPSEKLPFDCQAYFIVSKKPGKS